MNINKTLTTANQLSTSPVQFSTQDVEDMRNLVSFATAEHTRRAYSAQWNQFAMWCSSEGYTPTPGTAVPVEVVAKHITAIERAGAKMSTIRARIAAIAAWHKSQTLDNPTDMQVVRTLVRGCVGKIATDNQQGVRIKKQAKALTATELKKCVDLCDTTTTKGLRDRAVLLVGFCGAFRRSELTALQVDSVEDHERGLIVHTYATKTNKTGAVEKELEYSQDQTLCPVLALRAWLDHAGITSGCVFRSVSKGGAVGGSLSGRAVSDIVSDYATRAGLGSGWSGHSLRAGYATQSQIDNVPEAYARKQGGWSNASPVFLGYAGRAERFKVQRVKL